MSKHLLTDAADPLPGPMAQLQRPRYGPGQEISQAKDGRRIYRLADGWAFSGRFLKDGRRQIADFLLPGDPVNAAALLGGADGLSVFALNAVTLVPADGDTQAVGTETSLALLARRAEHLITLGRRTAYERVAALLLQLCERLDARAGRQWPCYHVPLRLEHVADHLGLSIVHVSRTMSQLRENRLGQISRGKLEIWDRARLAELVA